MSSRSKRSARQAVALPFAASLLLFAGAAPAFAESTYSPSLRQELPRTATSEAGGVPQEGREGCPGIPEGKDGWHFVLPGNDADFVKLTVTFEPGGQQVVTDFGPPSEKHAYVASEPGARLVAVEAEVTGGSLEKFNLSHTCPAGTTPTTPGEEPTDEPTGTPSPDASEPTTPEPTEPAAAEESGASEAPVGGGGEDSGGETGQDGDLAATGSGAPVGALTAGAAVLVGAGGYLVLRRRRATQQN